MAKDGGKPRVVHHELREIFCMIALAAALPYLVNLADSFAPQSIHSRPQRFELKDVCLHKIIPPVLRSTIAVEVVATVLGDIPS